MRFRGSSAYVGGAPEVEHTYSTALPCSQEDVLLNVVGFQSGMATVTCTVFPSFCPIGPTTPASGHCSG